MSLLYAILLDWENEGGHKKDWALDEEEHHVMITSTT